MPACRPLLAHRGLRRSDALAVLSHHDRQHLAPGVGLDECVHHECVGHRRQLPAGPTDGPDLTDQAASGAYERAAPGVAVLIRYLDRNGHRMAFRSCVRIAAPRRGLVLARQLERRYK